MTGPVKINCPKCDAKIRLKSSELLDRGVRCPACGASFSRKSRHEPEVENRSPSPSSEQSSPAGTNSRVTFAAGVAIGLVLPVCAWWLFDSSGVNEQAPIDGVSSVDPDNASDVTPQSESTQSSPHTDDVAGSQSGTNNGVETNTPEIASVSHVGPTADPVGDIDTFEQSVRPFFALHCNGCHGDETAEADLRLDTIPADFLSRQPAAHWVEVLDRLNLGEMPPEGEERPEADKLGVVTDWISEELSRIRDIAASSGGRVLLRRLTRTEYTNTVRDLFGIEFFEGEGPAEMLPPDGSIKGFNRISKGLLLDPSLMESYVKVAQYVVEKAVATRPPKAASRITRFEFEKTPETPMNYIVQSRHADLTDDGMILYETHARTYGELLHPYNGKQTPVDGEYLIRVSAGARPGQNGQPVYMDVTKGTHGLLGRILIDAPIDEPKVFEIKAVLSAVIDGELQITLADPTQMRVFNYAGQLLGETAYDEIGKGNVIAGLQLRARARAEGVYDIEYHRQEFLPEALDLDAIPKLFLDYVEIEGPLGGRWPPPSREMIYSPLGDARPDPAEEYEPVDDDSAMNAARRIITEYLPKAFRRPVKTSEVDEVLNVIKGELQSGQTFEEALKTGFVAMLCAPDFLYLFEPGSEHSPEATRRLTDLELATRTSYFLWSSMPDSELAQLAETGQISQADVLTAQVDRMLGDPRSDALVQDFAAQWMKVSEFDKFPPDERIFPEYYANEFTGIGEDMSQEPLAFFRELLHHDLSVLNFLDSDWTMANAKLAGWYGIDGVNGKEFQRVSFPNGSPRGGLLAMAGVARWGSDGNRTKPVERGKYILDVLFNDPPPPPPPNAGEVEPNLGDQILTVRERLEKHRHVATCRNCHRRIDPYGLALENFNVIGRWRDRLDGERPVEQWGDNRPAIECNGTLPNGTGYSSFAEFKAAIVDQGDRFQRALTEKLLMYALGRTLEATDRPTVDSLVNQMQSNNHTLRSLIQGIIRSEAFQTK